MTSKTLTGIYGATYYLKLPITNLTVAASGYLGGGLTALGTGAYGIANLGEIVGYGAGVTLAGSGSLTNSGTIVATATMSGTGVILGGGGTVANGAGGATTALITGYNGVAFDTAAGTVTNGGTIRATKFGAELLMGGVVTNGALTDTTAAIEAQDGVYAGATASVHNYGTLACIGGAGVYLKSGGVVTNGAAGDTTAIIFGGTIGIAALSAAATVSNQGTIESLGAMGAGIALEEGGVVVNGAATNTTAFITGATGVGILGKVGTVTNYGTIHGGAATVTSDAGVIVTVGGVITNGSTKDTHALIDGYIGAEIVLGTLNNFGTIGDAKSEAGAVAVGGKIINGSTADTTALIQGDLGAAISQYAGAITNFGTLLSNGAGGPTTKAAGAYLAGGGAVTNGTASDTSALIAGLVGVEIITARGAVTNFAAIGGGDTLYGVYLGGGGQITNGAASDTAATVTGNVGLIVNGAAGTVRNFGTVFGGGAGFAGNVPAAGIILEDGGTVTNGSAADAQASISGVDGVYGETIAASVTNFGLIVGGNVGVFLKAGGSVANETEGQIKGRVDGILASATATVNNLGTIRAGANLGVGAYLQGGGVLSNGSSADHGALIYGHYGVVAAAPAKIANNGTISGAASASGVGVDMAAGSTLSNEAGALVEGFAGVSVTAASTVNNFGTIQSLGGYAVMLLDSTARLNAESGSAIVGTISAGNGLVDIVGGVATAAAVDSSGKIEGTGTLSLVGGTSALGAGVSLTVAKVEVSGAGTTVNIFTKLLESRIWDQTAGTLSINGGDQMTFTGAGNGFSGSVDGAGTLFFDGGADTLSNVSLAAGKMVISKSAVTLSGQVGIIGTLDATTSNLVVSAGNATLNGGGELLLSNTATNSLHGVSAGSTLTNQDTIKGAGKLGGGVMTLVNDTAGTIESSGSVGLTIDTGANSITNAGVIEALTGGGIIVSSAVSNTGTLMAFNGTLTVNGAVTGAGIVKVVGGLADFAGAFNEKVDFGASGRLVLAHSQTYGGTIAGFSHTGTTSMDLADIAFSGATTATYSGTATSGVLTVSDGTHTANIHLSGNYLTASWELSAATGGGTHVIDPTAPKPAAAPLIAAMAGFGAGNAGSTPSALPAWMTAAPILLSRTG